MHTISAEELLKAYNGKYKYMTMDESGLIMLWGRKPEIAVELNGWVVETGMSRNIGKIAITEFQGKDWTECIYKAKPSEENWVGCLCAFAETRSGLLKDRFYMRHLKAIKERKYIDEFGGKWNYCRLIYPDEIKFFNDDTSEE